MGEKGILLCFIKTVHLVNKEDSFARVVVTALLGTGNTLPNIFYSRKNRIDGYKLSLRGTSNNTSQSRFSGTRWTIEDKTAQLIGQEIVDDYSDEKYDAVYVIYNAFQSAIVQNVTVERVLPIEPKESVESTENSIDYLYEPDRTAVLSQLLPKMVEVQIFRALLESNASEQGARMSSMDSASRNAAEMIDKLTLQYNRARQAAITKELMEIISGAESIK